jgi:alpha-ketoglutarate-dependent taurine dioxygenase
MDLPHSRIAVAPTGAALGADVTGVDVARPLDDAAFRAIESAWHRCTMHRRDAFDPRSRRLMHRTQIKGDKPFFDPASVAA